MKRLYCAALAFLVLGVVGCKSSSTPLLKSSSNLPMVVSDDVYSRTYFSDGGPECGEVRGSPGDHDIYAVKYSETEYEGGWQLIGIQNRRYSSRAAAVAWLDKECKPTVTYSKP